MLKVFFYAQNVPHSPSVRRLRSPSPLLDLVTLTTVHHWSTINPQAFCIRLSLVTVTVTQKVTLSVQARCCLSAAVVTCGTDRFILQVSRLDQLCGGPLSACPSVRLSVCHSLSPVDTTAAAVNYCWCLQCVRINLSSLFLKPSWSRGLDRLQFLVSLCILTGVYYDYVSLCSRYSILDPYCSRGAIGRAVCGRCDLMILWFRHVVGFDWCYGPVAWWLLKCFLYFLLFRYYECVQCISFFCICSLFDMCCLLA